MMPDENPPLAPTPKDAPKEPPKDSQPPKDKEAPKDKDDKGFDPGPDHPRFKEVYWKMKKYEREGEESKKDIEAMRAHNAQMQSKLEEIERRANTKPDEPEPDIVADPDGYRAWARLKQQKLEKDYLERRNQDRIAAFIEIETGLHEDYAQAAAIAERDIALDPALSKKIWGSSNPAREAYKYGRKKMDEAAAKDNEETERQERLDAGRTEPAGDNPPPAPKDDELSDDEKRVIRNLFRDMDPKEATKKYREQKKALARG
jgi:hypothetical protein